MLSTIADVFSLSSHDIATWFDHAPIWMALAVSIAALVGFYGVLRLGVAVFLWLLPDPSSRK